MPSKQVVTSGGNPLQVKEFKLDNIAKNSAIVMVAKRGSGKSWVCRDIIKKFSDIPVGNIISPTEPLNNFYKKFYPDSYIFHDYNSDIISRIFARQMIMKRKNKDKNSKKKKIDLRCMLVMDDCLGDNTWKKDEQVRTLLYNGRHYNIMYILTMQYPMGIPPNLRTQFDYIFLLADDNYNNVKKMYEQYAGIFPSLDSFRQVFKQLTSDHGCMVIVNTNRGPNGQSNELLDKIFWYKANDNRISDIGCSQFRKYHKKNYDREWEDKKMHINPDEYFALKKREKSVIKIEKIEDD
jgi:hypothetical protein